MPQSCAICTHSKRNDIERAVIQGESLRKIALRFGKCSAASVSRHTKRCVAKALKQVSDAKREIVTEQDKRSAKVIHDHVTEQTRNGTLQTVATIETELNRLIDRMGKMFDACDEYLEDPDNPGTYTLTPRSDETRIIWEELEEETVEGVKPRWVKKAGTLQQALDIAFSNGHRRFVSATPVNRSDARKLILETALQISRQIEIMAKLEGRYTAPAPLSDGNTVQLVWIQQVLIQNGILKG